MYEGMKGVESKELNEIRLKNNFLFQVMKVKSILKS